MSIQAQLQSVEHEVREFIVSDFLFGQKGSLSDDESLVEQGVIDSTGILELVGFLEQRFKIEVEDEDVVPKNLDSICRIAEFIRRKTASM